MKTINIVNGPQNASAIIRNMNPVHNADASAASGVNLSHHDWYVLYPAAGKYLP
ncbi:MAG: hypothetical protein K6G19_02680 [Lachnospiraceae bacterium]|nr:hypothetical protein [Lachnospiraceae bacterium]